MKAHLTLLLGMGCLLLPSCLEKSTTGSGAEAKIAKLEKEKIALSEELAALKSEADDTKKALAETQTAAEQAKAEIRVSGDADDKVVQMEKVVADLKASMAKAESDHQRQVSDLQKQIQAMALEVPASDGKGRPPAPNTKTPRHKSSTERHVAPR